MPKLYEYFGIILLFYANEHDPIHVHGKCQGRESKAELIFIDGNLNEIRYAEVPGKLPLASREMNYFREIVEVRAHDIVRKWIDFFVFHKSVVAERIDRRLK